MKVKIKIMSWFLRRALNGPLEQIAADLGFAGDTITQGQSCLPLRSSSNLC